MYICFAYTYTLILLLIGYSGCSDKPSNTQGSNSNEDNLPKIGGLSLVDYSDSDEEDNFQVTETTEETSHIETHETTQIETQPEPTHETTEESTYEQTETHTEVITETEELIETHTEPEHEHTEEITETETQTEPVKDVETQTDQGQLEPHPQPPPLLYYLVGPQYEYPGYHSTYYYPPYQTPTPQYGPYGPQHQPQYSGYQPQPPYSGYQPYQLPPPPPPPYGPYEPQYQPTPIPQHLPQQPQPGYQPQYYPGYQPQYHSGYQQHQPGYQPPYQPQPQPPIHPQPPLPQPPTQPVIQYYPHPVQPYQPVPPQPQILQPQYYQQPIQFTGPPTQPPQEPTQQPTQLTTEPSGLQPETVTVEVGSDEDEEPTEPTGPPKGPGEVIEPFKRTLCKEIELFKKDSQGMLVKMTENDYKKIYEDINKAKYDLYENLELLLYCGETAFEHRPGNEYFLSFIHNKIAGMIIFRRQNGFFIAKKRKGRWIVNGRKNPDYVKLYTHDSYGNDVLLNSEEYYLNFTSSESFKFTFKDGVRCTKIVVFDLTWVKNPEEEFPLSCSITHRKSIILFFKNYFYAYRKLNGEYKTYYRHTQIQ